MSRSVRDLLTREEIARLTARSDWRGAREVFSTWAVIAGALALAAAWPSVWSVLLALGVLGNRQLALAILQHDAAHGILMRSRALNDLVGEWLCAAPNNIFMRPYWAHHRLHHVHAGTPRDPDRSLVAGFPTTRASMLRKFARDLAGLSSIKRLFAVLMMGVGKMKYTAAVDVTWLDTSERSLSDALATSARNLGPVLVWNAAFFAVLHLLGHGWLFALWWGAYLTTYSVFLRVRSFSEHGVTERSADVFRNTRTTLPSRLGRCLFAPHSVHFHLEHHLLMTVPCYHLEAFHALLEEKGVLRDACVARGGYLEVMRLVVVERRPEG